VTIEQIEWGQWLSRVWKDADYDLTIIGHAEPWDINNYANPKYYFRYDSATFQRLFAESEVTPNGPKRRALYVRMQQLLVEEAAARLREALGLNRPLLVQYADWLGRAITGDLGRSLQYDVPVSSLILSRLSVTVPLTLLASFFVVVTALPLGLLAATHHRRAG